MPPQFWQSQPPPHMLPQPPKQPTPQQTPMLLYPIPPTPSQSQVPISSRPSPAISLNTTVPPTPSTPSVHTPTITDSHLQSNTAPFQPQNKRTISISFRGPDGMLMDIKALSAAMKDREAAKAKKEDGPTLEQPRKSAPVSMETVANVKGKGKAPADTTPSIPPPTKATTGIPTCGICLECFLVTSNPATVSKGPTSSSRLPFGLRLPCPQEHAYCLKCLKSYLQSKLAEGNTGNIVFPIRCPECPIDAWSFGDEVAAKVLDSADVVQWVGICATHGEKKLFTMGTAFPKATRHYSSLLLS